MFVCQCLHGPPLKKNVEVWADQEPLTYSLFHEKIEVKVFLVYEFPFHNNLTFKVVTPVSRCSGSKMPVKTSLRSSLKTLMSGLPT